MEGSIQRTSSQSKETIESKEQIKTKNISSDDTSNCIINNSNNNNNNHNNNNNNINLSNSKPPLLPKPQFIRLKSSIQRNIKSNFESPENSRTEADNYSDKNNFYSSIEEKKNIAAIKVTTQMPPKTSNKPQLPPKLFMGNCSNISFINFNSSLSSKNSSCDSAKLESFTMGPAGFPYTVHKKDTTHVSDLQKDFVNSSDKLKTLINCHEKSFALDFDDKSKQKLEDVTNNCNQVSKFFKEVEVCSKHSYLLKKNIGLDLQSSQSAVNTYDNNERVDLKSSKILRNDINYNSDDTNEKLNKFCAKNCIANGSDGVLLDESTNFISDTESKLTFNTRKQNLEFINGKGSNLVNQDESPKSFLYRYIGACNQSKNIVKSQVKNDQAEEKNINDHSLLHTKWEQPINIKMDEVYSQTQALSDYTTSLCAQHTAENVTDKEEEAFSNKKSDHLFRVNSSKSDSSSFSKRFPWFGSFGKGNKKEAGKKQRCISQFYSSSSDIKNEMFKHKNRTKSLPDIKHARIAAEESFISKSPGAETKRATSISNDCVHSDSDDDKDSLNQAEDLNSDKDLSNNTRAFLKAKELMTSEEVFIDVLKLLNVDFRNHVQLKNFESKNTCIPMNEVNKILNHLAQLQSLNEDILEDLRGRIENWESNQKISDVIVKKGAFLKMYTTYIQNFESQTNYLDECMLKYPKFNRIVKDFEASDRCKKLSLKHYMLKPVQRIPQYRLLLNDYLKCLDEASVDFADTQNALKIVSEVVDHANRTLAYGDKEGRLMHFQSLLSDYVLIKPGRELLKDGPLEKICRKSVKDRYFLLLNDCLLHTTYSKQYMKIHQELPLSGMKICCNDDQIFPHSFTVHSIKRSFILCAKTGKDCKDWVDKLSKAIEEFIKKQKTFFNVKIEEADSGFKLGKEAPVWVPDSKVTMCQICTAEFTALFRRHHCRGCGKVVCRNCGRNQAPLQYANFKADRVCDHCFDLLFKDYEESEDGVCQILKETLNVSAESLQSEYLSIKSRFLRYNSANSLKKQKNIPQRLKEVSANDSESTISGWLYRKSRKSWKLFWYVLKDHVLYVYKASEDVVALQTIPVLGYEVERVKVNEDDVDQKLVFSLVHPSQNPLIFRAESENSADRWFEALTAASHFDHIPV